MFFLFCIGYCADKMLTLFVVMSQKVIALSKGTVPLRGTITPLADTAERLTESEFRMKTVKIMLKKRFINCINNESFFKHYFIPCRLSLFLVP